MSPSLRLILVWAALMLLLALTVGATFLPLGHWRTVTSYGIAMAKAALVLWFFMELRSDSGLSRLAVLTGFVWIGLLFLLIVADYVTRGWTAAGAF